MPLARAQRFEGFYHMRFTWIYYFISDKNIYTEQIYWVVSWDNRSHSR